MDYLDLVRDILYDHICPISAISPKLFPIGEKLGSTWDRIREDVTAILKDFASVVGVCDGYVY